MLIGITGTPGSGKSAFARLLRSKAKIEILEINDIARRYRAYSDRDRDGTMIADMKKLNAAVRKELRGLSGKNVAIVGHLSQELSVKPDIFIVIRARPSTLYKRQKARSYSLEKIKENIISEALDYCGEGARKICSNSFEVETKAEKNLALRYLAAMVRKGARNGKAMNARARTLKSGKDMMPDFLRFIRKSNIGL